MPTPEICFLRGQFRLTILAKVHHGESLMNCLWIEHTTFQLRGGHSTTGLLPPQRNLRHQRLGVKKYYDVQLGCYWETKVTRKTTKLDYLPWFHAKCFIRFWEEGQYKPKTTGNPNVLVSGRMSSLSFLQRTFDWDGWNGFVRRGRCRDWGTNGPQVSIPVTRGRRKMFRLPWNNVLDVV